MNFTDVFRWLGKDMGILESFLPFLLVFVIIFAVLERTKVLGADSKKFNAILALVIGLLVVIPHVLYPGSNGKLSNGMPDVVAIMNESLPTMAAIFVALVLTLVLMSLASNEEGEKKFKGKWVPYVALAIVIYVFGASANWWGNILPLSSSTISLVVIILVAGLIFMYIVGGDSNNNGGKPPKKPGEE